jgi:hypothetical protein
MKQTSVERIGRSQLIPGVRRTWPSGGEVAKADGMSDTDKLHFAVFMLASFGAFLTVLKLVLRKRQVQPGVFPLTWVSGVVVALGMSFAKVAANSGLPSWVYYGIPAAVTLLLPPVVFRMRRAEVGLYVCAAFLVSPAIHVAFSLILGWKEYLPFWAVPSLRELLS